MLPQFLSKLNYLNSNTSYSGIVTPHFAMALKKSYFFKIPSFAKSKNLNIFNKTVSTPTLDDALNYNFVTSSFSNC